MRIEGTHQRRKKTPWNISLHHHYVTQHPGMQKHSQSDIQKEDQKNLHHAEIF